MSNTNKTKLAAALGAAFLATAVAPIASADVNPFTATQLNSGYDLANYGHHEGKCGGDKAAKEGKCGGDKAAKEGKCGGDKAAKEGLCGGDKAEKEGKCGGDKAEKEGKCGEGKCGGDKK